MGLIVKVGDQGHLTVVLMKRRDLHTQQRCQECMCREKRLCVELAREQPSVNQGEKPQRKQTLLAL